MQRRVCFGSTVASTRVFKGTRSIGWGSSPSEKTGEQHREEEQEEDYKEDPREGRRNAGNAKKTESPRNNGDQEKKHGPDKHDTFSLPWVGFANRGP